MYFKVVNNDGFFFAVKKLLSCFGVRILFFVNKDMDEVERFYILIIGKILLVYNKIEEGFCYRKFFFLDKLEF